MKRLIRRLVCRYWLCRITRKPVWDANNLIGWSDECERCGESQFKPVGVP